LVDEKGESRISIEDYAVAIVDLVEKGGHERQRITVAY
jgi:putative NADH-flavin reductase